MKMNYQDWIGNTQIHKDVVSSSPLDRFKSTLGHACSEKIVPDGYHWCLGLPKKNTEDLGVDGHPPLGDFMPALPFPRRMWASSDVEFIAPLKPGMEIERHSTISNIVPKFGRSGNLVFVDVDHETLHEEFCLIREKQTIVYRDYPTEKAPMPKVAEVVDLSDWEYTETLLPTSPLLFRYSAITFNSHRIHYDQTYTRDVELYPALVVHGPLTASLLLRLSANSFGHNRLSRFKYRARAPLFVGQPLYLTTRRTGNNLEFCAFGGDGRVAVEASGFLNEKREREYHVWL